PQVFAALVQHVWRWRETIRILQHLDRLETQLGKLLELLARHAIAEEVQRRGGGDNAIGVVVPGAANHLAPRAQYLVIEFTDGAKIKQHDLVMVVAGIDAQQVVAEVGIGLHAMPLEHLTTAQLHDRMTDEIATFLAQLHYGGITDMHAVLE